MDVICDDDVMARMIGNMVSVGSPVTASSTSGHHIHGNRRQDSTDTLPEYDNSTELTDISHSYHQPNAGRQGHTFVVSSDQTTSVSHGNSTNATIPDLLNTNEDLHLDYTDKLEYATQLWEGIQYLPDQVERSFLGLPQTKVSPPTQVVSPFHNMAAVKAAKSASKTLKGVDCTYSRRAAVRCMTRNRRPQLFVSTVPSPSAQKSDCDDENEDDISPGSALSSTGKLINIVCDKSNKIDLSSVLSDTKLNQSLFLTNKNHLGFFADTRKTTLFLVSVLVSISDDDDENDMDYNSKVDGKLSRARSSGTTSKLPGIIQYLHTSLREGQPYIEWIGNSKTMFRITEPNQIARIWGQRSNHKEGRKALDPNSDFKYEHFSRALR